MHLTTKSGTSTVCTVKGEKEGKMTYANSSTIDRAESLRTFRNEISSVDLKQDAEFQRILRQAQELLVLSDQEIADELSVSRPTVNRWVNGKNLPYLAMRKPIATWIDKQLSLKIRKIEALVRPTASSTYAASAGYRMTAKGR
jgi:ribosome-binding protein aMBF1 (putative translation factor)